MITATQIRDGKSYLRVHLSANDYYSEGETVTGEWWGRGAERLGLAGLEVTEGHFQALRNNQHPFTREKLTPRSRVVTYHDVVVSAPKSFSICAQVSGGGDERLVEAFRESVQATFRELEKLAAVRVRQGHYAKSEAFRVTGNAVTAVYHHDTSRLLDPQNHAHLVFANLSYDTASERWLALQPRPMMEESKKSVRQFFHRDLARRSEELGYETEWTKNGFRIKGVSVELEQKFSARAVQRKSFETRYQELFGKEPDPARIEAFIKEGKGSATKRFRDEFQQAFRRFPSEGETVAFVRDWRSSKMARSTKSEVNGLQEAKLTVVERDDLQRLKRQALHVSSLRNDAGKIRDGMGNSPESSEQEKQEKQLEKIDRQEGQKWPLPPSSNPKRVLEGDSLRARENALKQRQAQLRARQRMEVMRRYRRGMAVASALRGLPGFFLARELTRLAIKNHEQRT